MSGVSVDRGRLARQILIDIARRRQRPGTGSLVAALERSSTVRWPDLETTLSGIPWAVAGAVAARRYMPERATTDIDVIVPVTHAAEARRRFQEAGYVRLGDLAIGGTAWRSPTGAVVDLIEVAEPWWPVAIAEAQRNRDAEGFPILTLPYLTLMKLLASRVQDLADVSRMLGLASDADLDRVRSTVREHAPDLVDDLESLIALGRLEMEGQEPSPGSGTTR